MLPSANALRELQAYRAEVVDVELVHRAVLVRTRAAARRRGLEATGRGDPGDVEHLGEVGLGVPVLYSASRSGLDGRDCTNMIALGMVPPLSGTRNTLESSAIVRRLLLTIVVATRRGAPDRSHVRRRATPRSVPRVRRRPWPRRSGVHDAGRVRRRMVDRRRLRPGPPARRAHRVADVRHAARPADRRSRRGRRLRAQQHRGAARPVLHTGAWVAPPSAGDDLVPSVDGTGVLAERGRRARRRAAWCSAPRW